MNNQRTVLLDEKQSEDILITGITEGLFSKGSVDEFSEDYKKRIFSTQNTEKGDLFSKIVSHDKIYLTMPRSLCEAGLDNNIFESDKFTFAPRLESKPDNEPVIQPSIDYVAALTTDGDIESRKHEILSLLDKAIEIDSEFKERFPDTSRLELQLSDFVSPFLSSTEKEFLKQYENISSKVSSLVHIIKDFEAKICLSNSLDAYMSFDPEKVKALRNVNVDYFHRDVRGIFEPSSEGTLIQTVLLEIGAVPYRQTLSQSLKLSETAEMNSLRHYVSELSEKLVAKGSVNLDTVRSEIEYARKEFSASKKYGNYARIATYVGMPLAVAGLVVPPLGAAGLMVSLVGGYTTWCQDEKASKYEWLGISAV